MPFFIWLTGTMQSNHPTFPIYTKSEEVDSFLSPLLLVCVQQEEYFYGSSAAICYFFFFFPHIERLHNFTWLSDLSAMSGWHQGFWWSVRDSPYMIMQSSDTLQGHYMPTQERKTMQCKTGHFQTAWQTQSPCYTSVSLKLLNTDIFFFNKLNGDKNIMHLF